MGQNVHLLELDPDWPWNIFCQISSYHNTFFILKSRADIDSYWAGSDFLSPASRWAVSSSLWLGLQFFLGLHQVKLKTDLATGDNDLYSGPDRYTAIYSYTGAACDRIHAIDLWNPALNKRRVLMFHFNLIPKWKGLFEIREFKSVNMILDPDVNLDPPPSQKNYKWMKMKTKRSFQ